MNIEDAKGYIELLKQYLEIEKCKQCECLQGALMQIRLDWPDLKEEVDRLISEQLHRCLGCEPCPPAEVWVDYLKERDVN